jgi:hypothetical protein
MLDIVKLSHNGNGSGQTVSGRGLARRKLTAEQWLDLAADVACGQRPFAPSLAQIAALFRVSILELREELKQRAAAADGIGDNNDAGEPSPELEHGGNAEPGPSTVDDDDGLADWWTDLHEQGGAEVARWLAQCEAEAINAEADAIVEAWGRASPLGHEAAVRVIGAGNVWDVFAPVVM